MPNADLTGKSNRLLVIALAINLGLAILFQLPMLRDSQVIDEDLRFYYWVHRISDQNLFENDPVYGRQMATYEIGDTTLSVNKVSFLYSLLFVISPSWLDPILASKLLVFPLIIASTWLLFQLSRQIVSPFKATVICLLFALLVLPPHSEMSLTSGLQRSFNLVAVLALLYALERQKLRFHILPLFLGLVYPPMFILAMTVFGLGVILPAVKQRHFALTRRSLLFVFIAGLIGLIVLLPGARTGQAIVPESSGQFPTTTVFNSPMFRENGRYPILSPFPLSALGGIVDNSILGFYTLFLVGASLACWLILRGEALKLPQSFWAVFWASVICFILAWLPILFTSSPLLHFPSRYPRGILFLMGLVFVVANGPQALQRTSMALARSGGLTVWLVPLAGFVATFVIYMQFSLSRVTIVAAGLTILLVILALIRSWRRVETTIEERPARPQLLAITVSLILLPQLFILPVLQARLYKPSPTNDAVLQYLQKLPQDSLIAGDPCSLNDVPLYAKRAILFSCEVENPSLDLMLDFYDAYYATEMESVAEFCVKQGIDYLVVNEKTFTSAYLQNGRFWFEPIDSEVTKLVASRGEFALAQVPNSDKLFQAEHLFVMACPDSG